MNSQTSSTKGNDKPPVRVGMIGAGFISDYHLTGLRAAGAELTAICGLDLTQTEAQARRFGIPFITDSPARVLERDDVDAVVIATPDKTHKALAIAAAEAGKAILLQKPMAPSSAECREIMAAAQEHRVLLCVSWMHRYFEEVQKVRDYLADDALGRILTVRQRNATPGAGAAWFYRASNVPGGVVMQLGIHGIDLLRYLFGEIVRVKSTTRLIKQVVTLTDGTRFESDVIDVALATYEFASGALATHEMIWNELAGTDRFRMEIYGEDGTAWLRTERGQLALNAPKYLKAAGWFAPQLPQPVFGWRQHDHFLRMVQGEQSPDNSAYDGMMAVRVAEVVLRAGEMGSWEMVLS